MFVFSGGVRISLKYIKICRNEFAVTFLNSLKLHMLSGILSRAE